MHPHENLISQFYTAFRNKDYVTMQELYHPEATFSDPVFEGLSSKEVKAMWEMLLTSSKDLEVTFSNVTADGTRGGCQWDAWYTFSRTGRKVHNRIHAAFEFKDGKIFRHHDTFDFWRWSRQALGTSGLFLGWTSVVKNKVRFTARKALDKFMRKPENQ
ncbi:nuclear transport factor 2 family protein [Chryseolinea sp. Jin1]|uniref:Nuclear transport factor 2 family protein n=2 Tax=Chryseolinea lacunae TaxID=2801331 RepID=A0ABS1KJF8_9BACT|nr:nuclear transport factor 2 family protein [Chryseolinea lacunae]MBL0739600.1 nuclear transport factor 2 family protein [Chryseolinea lacunae]